MQAEMARTAAAPAVDNAECVNLALDAAALMVMSGGATTAANNLFTNLLGAFNADVSALTWRSDIILGNDNQNGQLVAFLRTIGGFGLNLSRASELTKLVKQAKEELMAPAAVACELKRIARLPSPYTRWMSVLAAGITAAAFSQIAVRNLGSLIVVFVAAAVGQYFRFQLQVRKVSGVTTTLICGILSAFLAAAALRLKITTEVPATLISSVIYMAPGLPLINGFLDIASQKYLIMGLERIANAALLFLAMAVAIAFAYLVVL